MADHSSASGLNLYIIAGPNGAGKTTFARKFLPDYARCLEFINADLIAGGLSPFAPQKAAVEAGKIMLRRFKELAGRKEDFGFETTLAGTTLVRQIENLKSQGYRVHIFYLWLASPELALQRIADRVRNGGHDVPEAVVRRRLDKSLRNFLNAYIPLADTWIIFDNSGEIPTTVAYRDAAALRIDDAGTYEALLERGKVK
jgi:predicted ABC-type ATPase